MATRAELPILQHSDQAAWRKWLRKHHADSPGVRLKLAKKGSGHTTLSHSEALEEALCFGWIDGQVGRFDEHFYLIRFTPRRPGSVWSQINREKATRLIAEGRMHPAGLAQVEAAQADGRWENAYEPQSRATVPEDFQAALKANAKAGSFFATLPGSARYAFLYRLHHVKDPKRRAKRIADYLELLEQERTLQD
jgi:uncharacterized protein YdeI (YjbR/CyaY-like superfamily)